MKGEQADPHVAVVGAGYWGKNLLRNFHDLNALTAICDVDEELAQAFQEQYPEARILTVWPYLTLGGVLTSDDVGWNTAFEEFASEKHTQAASKRWFGFGMIRKQ